MGGPDVQGLIAATLGGDAHAWQALWRAVEPALLAALRRPQVLGRLATSEDDCRNIVVEVMGRLCADGFTRLAQYAEARRENPELPFMSWLIVVGRRVAIDYMRRHEAYVDRRHEKDASTPGKWREIGEAGARRAGPAASPVPRALRPGFESTGRCSR